MFTEIMKLKTVLLILYKAPYAALQAYFDALRTEVANDGIKVAVFSPGFIRTDLSVNALIGSGEKHAVMDTEQASGMTTEYVADHILQGILNEEHEVLIAPLLLDYETPYPKIMILSITTQSI